MEPAARRKISEKLLQLLHRVRHIVRNSLDRAVQPRRNHGTQGQFRVGVKRRNNCPIVAVRHHLTGVTRRHPIGPVSIVHWDVVNSLNPLSCRTEYGKSSDDAIGSIFVSFVIAIAIIKEI